MNNNEAFNFADALYMHVLMGLDCEVPRPFPDDSQRPWSGLRVEASITGDATLAQLLSQALNFAGIPTAAAWNENVPEGTVVLFVGPPHADPLAE